MAGAIFRDDDDDAGPPPLPLASFFFLLMRLNKVSSIAGPPLHTRTLMMVPLKCAELSIETTRPKPERSKFWIFLDK